ncbi:MAG: EAL domain-containing protein, partial [Alphaproteobacteria bacterium]|nr:EAL domain-containing protein [Alphaproteobacteria bacterium]
TVKRINKEMKPDFIKLDMRLVHQLPQQDAMRTVHDIVEYTRTSNITLIAEGVERQETQDILAGEGITLFQGYLYSPPEQVALTAPVAKKPRKAAL